MAARPQTKSFKPARRKRGFERASGLLQGRIRTASESRGFAQTRLVTHWQDVVGEEVAKICEPVKISYSKGGMGASLLLLTTGSYAPILQSQLTQIKDKVNAVYGYNAISRIHITQTAPSGFVQARLKFLNANDDVEEDLSPQVQKDAAEMAKGAQDEGLNAALQTLAQNFLKRQETQKKDQI